MNPKFITAMMAGLTLASGNALGGGAQISPDDPAIGQTTIAPDPPATIMPSQGIGRPVSCRTARRIIRNHGFRQVQTVDCTGRTFDFTAWRLESFYKIRIARRDGRIVYAEPQRIKPLWDQ